MADKIEKREQLIRAFNLKEEPFKQRLPDDSLEIKS